MLKKICLILFLSAMLSVIMCCSDRTFILLCSEKAAKCNTKSCMFYFCEVVKKCKNTSAPPHAAHIGNRAMIYQMIIQITRMGKYCFVRARGKISFFVDARWVRIINY